MVGQRHFNYSSGAGSMLTRDRTKWCPIQSLTATLIGKIAEFIGVPCNLGCNYLGKMGPGAKSCRAFIGQL